MSTLNPMTILASRRGISIPEMLAGIAIVSLAAYVSISMVTSMGDGARKTEQSLSAGYLHNDLVSRMKKLLLDVVAEDGRHTRGLCRLMTTDARSAGIGLIRLDPSEAALLRVFPREFVDQNFAPDWTPMTCPGTSNELRFCYTMSGDSSSRLTPTSKGSNFFAIIRLRAVNMDPTSGTAVFSPLPKDQGPLDVKKVAFEILSSVGTLEGSKPSAKESRSNSAGIAWAAEVGHCNFSVNGRDLKLSVSGTGVGDPDASVVYNTTRYDERTTGPLDVSIQKRSIREGMLDNENFMKANYEKNIEMVCAETRYRCPRQHATARTFNPQIPFRMNVRYFANNNVNSRVESPFAFEPRIMSGGQDLLASSGVSQTYTVAGQPFQPVNRHLYQVDTAGTVTETELTIGGALVRTQVDVNLGNMEPLCQRMCDSGGLKQKHELAVNAILWNYRPDGTNYETLVRATNPIGCNACYAKSCSRFGIAAFGDMKIQPPEPVDGGLPECAAADTTERAVARQRLPASLTVGSAANQCVAARITGGKVSLETRSCTDTLPIICFNFGRFMPAREITSPGKSQLATATFANAQQRCFEMGRERGLTAEFARLFETSQRADMVQLVREMAASKPDYSYVNLANQGLFLAPQTPAQWEHLESSVVDFPQMDGKTFWTALRTNQEGHLTPDIPMMRATGHHDHNYAFYYDVAGRPTLRKIAGSKSAASSGHALLMHTMKYKGVRLADKSERYRHLCRLYGSLDYALSGSAGTFDDGPSACAARGGLFIPPTSTLGWSQALLTVAANHSYYAFPDPVTEPHPVWVALSGTTSGGGADPASWRIPASHSAFVHFGDNSELVAEKNKQEKACEKKKPNETLPHACPPDLSIVRSNRIDNRGRYLPSGSPTKTICRSGQGWTLANVGGCPVAQRANLDDLRASYLAQTDWVRIQSALLSTDIVQLRD